MYGSDLIEENDIDLTVLRLIHLFLIKHPQYKLHLLYTTNSVKNYTEIFEICQVTWM